MQRQNIKQIDNNLIQALAQQARDSERRRSNFNLHTDYNSPVQRLFICMQPDSYVCPHKHVENNKWEFFMVVKGRLLFVLYNDSGCIVDKIMLGPDEEVVSLEIPPNTWHSTVALHEDTVFFEVKEGPYQQITDKGFAHWAPKEGEAECQDYIQWLIKAEIGAKYPCPAAN
ncbi:WbuC family cupin fold metalloprotein [Catenovulum sediminis]|uniref:WbuC family cupin fold metalloprotein n=1 Tax=Catenovulum sediminis TaxID=1740262 RepID=A0ABV1RLL6_9ALTE|nr:WbuC family cupin fold metalloprotein [Catenovulum sediminis]